MSPALRVDLLAAGENDAEVEAFTASCPHSVAQQTAGWRRVIEAQQVDKAHVLLCRRGPQIVGALPAYLFRGPLGSVLCSCVQAGPLGGVACHPEADTAQVYAALLEAWVDLARQLDCAVATVITHPFWPDRELCERYLAPDYTLENVCQALDLERDLDASGSFVGASSNLRRNLRKLASSGLVIDAEQTPANVEAWWQLHQARHREIGVTPLPLRLFEAALEHAVPAGKAIFFFVRRGDSGELVGGGLYLQHGQVMDALMPSVRTDDAASGASFLLGLHSIRWARERGVRYYNWQPSPPESGVQRFKQQWGGRDYAYAYLTRVTGDVSTILASTPEAVKSGYPFHYVLPFDRIGGDGTRGASTRSSAWRRAGGSS